MGERTANVVFIEKKGKEDVLKVHEIISRELRSLFRRHFKAAFRTSGTVGRAHNIAFSFEGQTGNAKDSHRLMAFARPDQQKSLIEKLFEAPIGGRSRHHFS